MEKMGLFILASNDISISPEEILKYYKGQDNVEKGFKFLKSDTFRCRRFTSRIKQELKQ